MFLKDIANTKKTCIIIFFLLSFFVLSADDVSAQCADFNLMEQGDAVDDNSLDFVGFDASGDPVTSFFKFTLASDMVINEIKINLLDDSCFSSGNKVNVYISSNSWKIMSDDLEYEEWTTVGAGIKTIPLDLFGVSLIAGTTYEINFEPVDLGGGPGLCKIATDTSEGRTSSYVFPLSTNDVCSPYDSCPCVTEINSSFAYYDKIVGSGSVACTQYNPTGSTCIDYDDCEVPGPNTKLYNPNGFSFSIQKWEQYLDYPDIELVCAPPTFCGDNVVQTPNDVGLGGPANDGVEQCDGTDNFACGGYGCNANCVCNTFCGDNITQTPNDVGLGGPANDGVEQCDGTDDSACGGFGCTYCTCNPDPSDCVPLFDNTGGLVPCGKITDNLNTIWNETEPCKICHVVPLLYNIINYLIKIVALVTILAIVIGGILYVSSSGDANRVTIAKTAVTKSLQGFVFVLVAWVIVNVGMILFGFNDPLGDGSWAKFNCNLNTVPSFCGDGIVNGLEVCDFNAPAPFGIKDCETTFFDGIPSHCDGVPVAGTQNCNQCCSGWEDCTALLPTLTSGTSSACSTTSPPLSPYACCDLVGCGRDGCDCCGRPKFSSGSPDAPVSTGYITVETLSPCGKTDSDCKLNQSITNPKDWEVTTIHTKAYYRCWN